MLLNLQQFFRHKLISFWNQRNNVCIFLNLSNRYQILLLNPMPIKEIKYNMNSLILNLLLLTRYFLILTMVNFTYTFEFMWILIHSWLYLLYNWDSPLRNVVFVAISWWIDHGKLETFSLWLVKWDDSTFWPVVSWAIDLVVFQIIKSTSV